MQLSCDQMTNLLSSQITEKSTLYRLECKKKFLKPYLRHYGYVNNEHKLIVK